ncbi:MAG: hypothetical protein L0Z55_06810 [Planctomycetes bacterium]|nr:hypothetical protein [Planctomycetota bacterium]
MDRRKSNGACGWLVAFLGPKGIRHQLSAIVLGLAIAALAGAACSCTGGSASTAPSGNAPLQRGTVHVAIEETLDGEPTEQNVATQLVTRALVLHGYTPVADPSQARFLIEGKNTSTFFQDLKFRVLGQETHLEFQYEGEMSATVTDTTLASGAAGRTETIEVPRERYGRTDGELAERDIRRLVASSATIKLMRTKLLGDARVIALLDELNDPNGRRSFNDIQRDIVAVGYPAVPYLLAALTDERVVQAKGEYPGLGADNRDRLCYYHIADRALGDILRRESYLALDSEEGYRIRVITGWTWVWEDAQGIPSEHRTLAHKRETRVAADEMQSRQPETKRGTVEIPTINPQVTPAGAKEKEGAEGE